MVSRRTLLALLGTASATFAGGCSGGIGGNGGSSPGRGQEGSLLRSTARLPELFVLPLAVPSVLGPSGSVDGADLYEITSRSVMREIMPGLRTEVRGYEGLLPGPTIRSRLGDVILANGVPWPFLEVAPVKYRFRLLNACNARRLRVTLEPPPQAGEPFVQIGSDGGLLEAPQPLKDIYLTPAERFDVIVDFAQYPAGATITMMNKLGEGTLGQVMQFRITGHHGKDQATIPARLSRIERLDPARAVTR